jgi:hypothetical protein
MIGSSRLSSQTTSASRQNAAASVKPKIMFDPNQSLRWPSSSTNSSEPSLIATRTKPT